jgi:hypothetical protein
MAQLDADLRANLSPKIAECANAQVYWNSAVNEYRAYYPAHPNYGTLDIPCEIPTYAADLEAALAAMQPPPCRPGSLLQLNGLEASEAQQLTSVAMTCQAGYYAIELDAAGQAVQVLNTYPLPGSSVPQATIDCVLAALSGLTFPCSANSQFCPEHMIVE